MNCVKCYYNFDGVCASHSLVDDLDTYGRPIEDIMIFEPINCEDYKDRNKPQFDLLKSSGLQVTLSEQKEHE